MKEAALTGRSAGIDVMEVVAGELGAQIGDPITVVAGVMKEPLSRSFLLLVTIAKTARYAVPAVITLGIVG